MARVKWHVFSCLFSCFCQDIGTFGGDAKAEKVLFLLALACKRPLPVALCDSQASGDELTCRIEENPPDELPVSGFTTPS